MTWVTRVSSVNRMTWLTNVTRVNWVTRMTFGKLGD